MAEWLGRWAWNPEIPNSSPSLCPVTSWIFRSPWFNSSVVLVHIQLLCLLSVQILNLEIFLQHFFLMGLKSPSRERTIKYAYVTSKLYHISLFNGYKFPNERFRFHVVVFFTRFYLSTISKRILPSLYGRKHTARNVRCDKLRRVKYPPSSSMSVLSQD